MAVPNRQGGRRRRNKTDANGMPTAPRTIYVGDFDPDTEGSEENLVPAPEADESWHPVALNFYNGLRRSPQRLYYEESDWAFAFLLCEHLTRELEDKYVGTKKVYQGDSSTGLPIMVDEVVRERMPVGSLGNVIKAMEKLMVTEPDRRKARVEIERGAVVEDDLGQDIVSDRMQLLQGGKSEGEAS